MCNEGEINAGPKTLFGNVVEDFTFESVDIKGTYRMDVYPTETRHFPSTLGYRIFS